MAIFTNLTATEAKLHGIFESSRIKASQTGHIYDALVKNSEGKEIEVDNGVLIKIGDFTGNGLQEVAATIAKVTDKVAITGAPALVKDAFTKQQSQEYNYVNIAGNPVKSYELVEEDIFGVASYQFTNEEEVKVNAYVVPDGNGAYTVQTEAPDASAYGFIGKVHSISVGTFYTIVRVQVLQNKNVA